MSKDSFDKSVFINCPFDEDYEGIFQAILFCLLYLGYRPRFSTERNNSVENRLEKICGLIQESKFSIHDLSRNQAKEEGEYSRLNMPFELGIDYAYRKYVENKSEFKHILVLEEKEHQTKIALSDLAGCDIEAHKGEFEIAIRKVRNWFANQTDKKIPTAGTIYEHYTGDFSEWHYLRQLEEGCTEKDIQHYPTKELLESMKVWIKENLEQPL